MQKSNTEGLNNSGAKIVFLFNTKAKLCHTLSLIVPVSRSCILCFYILAVTVNTGMIIVDHCCSLSLVKCAYSSYFVKITDTCI